MSCHMVDDIVVLRKEIKRLCNVIASFENKPKRILFTLLNDERAGTNFNLCGCCGHNVCNCRLNIDGSCQCGI